MIANPFSGKAQKVKGNVKLNNYLNLIDNAFEQADTVSFNKLIPLEEVKSFYAGLLKKDIRRKAGAHQILHVNRNEANVLLTGMVSFGNSGDETNSAMHYSGIYRLEREKGDWKIRERIPFDRSNEILKQFIQLAINPGVGMNIKDTLTIHVNDPNGFVMRLNHRANISGVSLNGKEVSYLFDGGLLWIASSIKKKQQLILNYSLAVERNEKNVNSGYFGDIYGHVRNQYCWHPFFSFSSPNDRAEFVVCASLPKDYPLATSLPQTDRIQDSVRLIEARSEIPTFALSLYYDKEWKVSGYKKDKTDLLIYATPDFEPARDTLYKCFSKADDLLNARFGPARSSYIGIVQDRSGGGNGWKNRSNNTVIAAKKGSYLLVNGANPRAIFGHEIAHGWTIPQGKATNFLSEGWATYCEAYLLASYYGDGVIQSFFTSQKANYLNGAYNGKARLIDDYSNSGLSYGKGAWIFYMLEYQLGSERFNAAIRTFIGSENQDIESLIKAMSKSAGMDMKPYIMPWLENKTIPLLTVIHRNNYLTIRQEGELFNFPITVRFKFKNGSFSDQTFEVNSREQSFILPENGWESYVTDPLNRLLFNLK